MDQCPRKRGKAIDGSFFYHRIFGSSGSNRIVRDGTILELGTPGHQDNPHYCDSMDELYFDDDVSDLWLFKNGRAMRLPPPINGRTVDYQPFLTDECQTLFFTSNRGAGGGPFPLQVAPESSRGTNPFSLSRIPTASASSR